MVDETIVETVEEVRGDLNQLENDLSQAATQRKAQAGSTKPTQQQAPSNDEDKLPPKLRGKTPEQIAEMYTNLESAYGRMANDLGTQRKLTDRLLDLKRENDLGQNGAPQKVEVKSADLLENPTATLERFSQAREQQSAQRLADLEARLAAQSLQIAHPDYLQVAQSNEFAEWVQASPLRVRAALAAQQGDYSAASDLLTDFKTSAKKPQAQKQQTDETEDEGQQQRSVAQKASLESSGQSNAGVKKAGKIYRRADLMRLRAERPDAYYDEDFQNEILIAYNEGRVK